MDKRFWFFTISYLAVFSLCLFTSAYYHEQTHVKNCEYRGGNVTEFELFPNAHINCTKPPSEIDAFNEGIAYQLGGFYVGVGLMGFLLLVAVLDKRN